MEKLKWSDNCDYDENEDVFTTRCIIVCGTLSRMWCKWDGILLWLDYYCEKIIQKCGMHKRKWSCTCFQVHHDFN